jgi:alkanesulfonate monooxygenase SsuD/methylene tetrahydromethanopterin reductase-like flavin-dependent oxidoreductase (luciferase family)
VDRGLRMKVGVALNIASEPGKNDVEVLLNHLRMGDLLEPLGFDSIFALEHHFTDYIISPCPTSLLAYYAGRTSRIMLGTAVVVLPWHNPIEVAERLLLLDALSGHRGIFGFGRGRAPVEFAGFGVSAENASSRWLEALGIVRQALSGEAVKLDGEHFKVSNLTIRPKPSARSSDRLFGAAGSAEGARRVREAGLGLFLSTLIPRETLDKIAGCEVNHPDRAHKSKPVVLTLIAVTRDRSEAQELALQYFERDLRRAAAHYAAPGDLVQPISPHFVNEFLSRQIVGTPRDCIEQLRELERITGADHLVFEISYGGMPDSLSRSNLHLLASDILPVLQSW